MRECVKHSRRNLSGSHASHERPRCHGPASFAQLKYFARPASPGLRRPSARLSSEEGKEKKKEEEKVEEMAACERVANASVAREIVGARAVRTDVTRAHA